MWGQPPWLVRRPIFAGPLEKSDAVLWQPPREKALRQVGVDPTHLPLHSTENGGWITLSPLTVQPEPANLIALKTRILERWPMTSLLDVFKEADLRIRFTDVFRTATAWENLDREVLQERLLLTLYGLGSNAGIKRMSAGQQRSNYKDLLYVRRRYITKDQIRAAIREVVNATLQERSPMIWGEGTTACASDSKKFGAWDQNLMTEWHARYGGRDVMIFWHVDRKSTCIYSQLSAAPHFFCFEENGHSQHPHSFTMYN
jgi:Tn3 transposase DDE domain